MSDLGVVDIPGVVPFDQAAAPPVLGVAEGTSGINPDTPGRDFGVVNDQGFQRAFDPTPPTVGVATGNDATFFIF